MRVSGWVPARTEQVASTEFVDEHCSECDPADDGNRGEARTQSARERRAHARTSEISASAISQRAANLAERAIRVLSAVVAGVNTARDAQALAERGAISAVLLPRRSESFWHRPYEIRRAWNELASPHNRTESVEQAFPVVNPLACGK